MKEVNIYIEKCSEDAKIPEYSKKGDAGMDIHIIEDIKIKPGETVIAKTGLKFAIPEGYELQVRPRSGISVKTMLRISNSPGTIDSGYRDELGIIISNMSDIKYSDNEYILSEAKSRMGTYKIQKGDRIAQIVLNEVPVIKFSTVESVKDIGSNRGGGFGSTGV